MTQVPHPRDPAGTRPLYRAPDPQLPPDSMGKAFQRLALVANGRVGPKQLDDMTYPDLDEWRLRSQARADRLRTLQDLHHYQRDGWALTAFYGLLAFIALAPLVWVGVR